MENILLIEDDVQLNKIVCSYLRNSGFEATGCLNATDAYREMYNLYELIISDIMMPKINGFEFDLPSKQKGFQLGIDDYMVKPVELDELLLATLVIFIPMPYFHLNYKLFSQGFLSGLQYNNFFPYSLYIFL